MLMSLSSGTANPCDVWWVRTMDGQQHISEHSLSERERALQEKTVRLEKKLEGYQSQIGNTHKSANTRR